MVLKFSNTLNQQKQPVNIEGCNVPDRANTDLFQSINISDGSNRSATLNVTNVDITVLTLTNSDALKINFPFKHQTYFCSVADGYNG